METDGTWFGFGCDFVSPQWAGSLANPRHYWRRAEPEFKQCKNILNYTTNLCSEDVCPLKKKGESDG